MSIGQHAPLVISVALGAMLLGALFAANGSASAGRRELPAEVVAGEGASGPSRQGPTSVRPRSAASGDRHAGADVSAEHDGEPREVQMSAAEWVWANPSRVLRFLEARGGRRFELVRDRAAFSALFDTGEPSVSRVESRWDGEQDVPDGAHITLKAGVHHWDLAGYARSDEFPDDVIIQGAGMDQTVLHANELACRGEIRRLHFRDLTIDCSDRHFTDLTSRAPVSIRLVRCRIVGFDNGAGGSVMLRAKVAAFHAIDSRFEAGFADTTVGFGNLFRVRTALLARMDGCTFVGPFRSVFDPGPDATYVFSKCLFLGVKQVGRAQVLVGGARPDGVVFDGCVSAPGGVAGERALTEINPAWR